jgi:hypothetical protein
VVLGEALHLLEIRIAGRARDTLAEKCGVKSGLRHRSSRKIHFNQHIADRSGGGKGTGIQPSLFLGFVFNALRMMLLPVPHATDELLGVAAQGRN